MADHIGAQRSLSILLIWTCTFVLYSITAALLRPSQRITWAQDKADSAMLTLRLTCAEQPEVKRSGAVFGHPPQLAGPDPGGLVLQIVAPKEEQYNQAQLPMVHLQA